MYYPDARHLNKVHKIMQFSERIKGRSREEREIFDQLRKSLENGDINRAIQFLDKNIMRIERRLISKAS